MLLTYRFVVEIASRPIGAFMECSLPAIKWEVQPIQEGGLNTYIHQLPKARERSQITLKRGLGLSTDLLNWYQAGMAEQFERKTVTIVLMNSLRQPVFSWTAENAYPIEWTGPQLQAESNTVAIETLVLACGEVTVTVADQANVGSQSLNAAQQRFDNSRQRVQEAQRQITASVQAYQRK